MGQAHDQRHIIGIIGAGVTGLQVAAALQKAGLHVRLFEKSSNVGGVWQKNYAGYSLQVQRWHYDIPGYPWPEGTSYPYPTGQEVQAYLESFARDSGLIPLITFDTEVQGISPRGEDGEEGWMITYNTLKADGELESNSITVGFVVFATGLFNTPARPDWASVPALAASSFHGLVVNARDFTDAAVATGKHVVVIGAGKTAIDVAVEASKVAKSTTLLARRGHVWAPQWVLGFIPFEWAVYTRWAWALQPAWYTAGTLTAALHKLFLPVKAVAWKVFELLFPLQTGTPSCLVHPQGILEGVYDTIGIVPAAEVRRAFNSRAVTGLKGEVATLDTNGLRLTSGETLQADIVVLATGYQNNEQQLLPEKLQPLAGYDQDGNQWLYRNVLPVGLHNLAFIGLNATFQHVLTTALQARWLTAVLTGELKLPDRQQQLADTQAKKEWLASSAFPFKRTNNFVWAQHGKFHDQLVSDLGYLIRRKGLNAFAELFAYIRNEDFVDVVNLAPTRAVHPQSEQVA